MPARHVPWVRLLPTFTTEGTDGTRREETMTLNRLGLAAALAAAMAFAGNARAQGSSTSGAQGSPGSSSAATGTTTSGTVKKSLSDGLERLHAANQAEIQMGKAAESAATDEQVKTFARRMADDHQQNDTKLTEMAQTLGVDLNGKAFQDAQKDSDKAMQKVHGKTGADFDKAYMDHMVKDHEKDVKDADKLAKEARKEKQTDLAAFLEQTHSGMQTHLQEAKRVDKLAKAEKKSGHRQGRTPSTSHEMGTGAGGGAAESPPREPGGK
jgi:putative membrane protein